MRILSNQLRHAGRPSQSHHYCAEALSCTPNEVSVNYRECARRRPTGSLNLVGLLSMSNQSTNEHAMHEVHAYNVLCAQATAEYKSGSIHVNLIELATINQTSLDNSASKLEPGNMYWSALAICTAQYLGAPCKFAISSSKVREPEQSLCLASPEALGYHCLDCTWAEHVRH